MTRTTYTVEGHDYDCTAADPATCTAKGHWDMVSSHTSLEDAEGSAAYCDTPAVRIIETRTVVTTRVVRASNSTLPVR